MDSGESNDFLSNLRKTDRRRELQARFFFDDSLFAAGRSPPPLLLLVVVVPWETAKVNPRTGSVSIPRGTT
jgi:hypothetical protein